MQKRIIIFGKANSGKSHLANQMAMAFENPVFTTRKHIGNHGFRNSGIDKSTDLCVIEDYTKISMIYHFPTEETILVDNKMQSPFTMPLPKTILTIECDEAFIDDLPEEIKSRSIFIKCEADHSDTMPALQANRYYTQTEILNA